MSVALRQAAARTRVAGDLVGDICELGRWGRVLSGSEISQAVSSLRGKWGF